MTTKARYLTIHTPGGVRLNEVAPYETLEEAIAYAKSMVGEDIPTVRIAKEVAIVTGAWTTKVEELEP